MPRRLLVLALILAAPAALAQSEDAAPPDAPRYVVKDVTILDIERGAEVTADVVRPSGVAVWEVRRAQFEPMIDLRRDFGDEIDASVDVVR